jgi:hypothetical protein
MSRVTSAVCFSIAVLAISSNQEVSQGTNLASQAEAVSRSLGSRSAQLVGEGKPLSFYISELSRQLKVDVIIDDTPQRQEADLDILATGANALSQVADRFDYTWEILQDGMVLLRKRFKEKNEHPQTNFPELQRTARDICATLSPLPDGSTGHWSNTIRVLFQSLTQDQISSLSNGARLKVADLSAAQQRLVERAILRHGFSDDLLRPWKQLANRLDTLAGARIEVRSYPEYYKERGDKPGNLAIAWTEVVLLFDTPRGEDKVYLWVSKDSRPLNE